MNKDDGKNKKAFFLIGAIIVVALVSVVSVYCGWWTRPRDSVSAYVFDGWVYGREDQKRADAALATAGLDNYEWKDGRLSVPSARKSAYQAALASASAYPKAPSESRRDALRDMSVFESDAKTNLRELDACALQLERTIEQMRGVDYATVGTRSRRERAGLSMKDVVTVSVGVACKSDFQLNSDMVGAITLAAKHLLGIDDDRNISIVDLREGKSYLGTDSSDGQSRRALTQEKERLEKYWREKYLEAFSDIKNIRVSVAANVAFNKPEEEAAVLESHCNDEIRQASGIFLRKKEGVVAEPVTSRSQERVCSASAKEEEDSSTEPPVGFVQLGAPRGKGRLSKKNVLASRPNVLQLNEEASPTNVEVARNLDVVAEDRDENVPSFYSEGAENLCSAYSPDNERSPSRNASSNGYLSMRPVESVESGNVRQIESDISQKASSEKQIYRQVSAERFVRGKSNSIMESDETINCGKTLVLSSISVQIALPRSYARRVARQVLTERAASETYASDPAEESAFYSEMETKILDEVKRFAIALFQPTSESLGWNDETLERSFDVSFYSSPDSVAVSELQEDEGSVRVSANYPNEQLEKSEYNDDVFPSTATEVEEDYQSIIESNAAEHVLNLNRSGVNSDAASNTDAENVERLGVADVSGKVADMTVALPTSGSKEDSAKDLGNRVNSVLNKAVRFFKVKVLDQPDVRNFTAGILAFFVVAFVALSRKKREKRQCERSFSRREERNTERRKSSQGEGSQNTAIPLGRLEDLPTSRDAKNECEAIDVETATKSAKYSNDFEEFDPYSTDFDDELEGELLRIAASKKDGKRASSECEVEEVEPGISEDYWKKRREALDVVSRFPERAAASLQGWVKGNRS